MVEFIAKYWLEVVFGAIIGVLSFFVKKFYTLWKQNEIAQEDIKIQEALKDIRESNQNLLEAVLEVQRKQFMMDCYHLLSISDEITIDQFENIYKEYEIYRSLGGNGYGSTLFELVQDKYNTQLFSRDSVDMLHEYMRTGLQLGKQIINTDMGKTAEKETEYNDL